MVDEPKKVNDGGPACKWCSERASHKQGRIWLCPKHYRFQQMRGKAQQSDKTVPSYLELDAMVPDELICVGCRRRMNWLQRHGASTVITLQHDRCGDCRLICLSCNTRHGAMPGDTFYDMPLDSKRCPRCKEVKPFTQFGTDNGLRWKSKKTYCKGCANAYHREWASKNRERLNREVRERRAAC